MRNHQLQHDPLFFDITLANVLSFLVTTVLCILLTSCGGGGTPGTLPVSVPDTPVVQVIQGNEVAITVDNGPAGARGTINQPYVSVTVCRPGTSICQTIDHILLDTASVGLRLIAPDILRADLGLPSVTESNGLVVAECANFASGYQWGSVRQADVKIGSEIASALPVHILSDGAAEFATVPGDCKSRGLNIGSVAALGANGILGVGFLKEDCGQACALSVIPGTYYACDTRSCNSISLPLMYQVANPVASFSRNKNGVLITMNDVAVGGTSKLTGSLIFGIGTQSNNVIAGESVYLANSVGNFTTVYNGKALTSSFIDSGSNGYYFDDRNIPACTLSTSFYCPAAITTFTAINQSFDGSRSGLLNFQLENVDRLSAGTVAARIGGNGSGFAGNSNSFDWGLPFFFGRRVFVAMKDAGTPNGNGPYWAY
jgi:hypothetical protein